VEDIKQKWITIFALGIWKGRRDVKLVTFSSDGMKMCTAHIVNSN
jgi:hypothetical protein